MRFTHLSRRLVAGRTVRRRHMRSKMRSEARRVLIRGLSHSALDLVAPVMRDASLAALTSSPPRCVLRCATTALQSLTKVRIHNFITCNAERFGIYVARDGRGENRRVNSSIEPPRRACRRRKYTRSGGLENVNRGHTSSSDNTSAVAEALPALTGGDLKPTVVA